MKKTIIILLIISCIKALDFKLPYIYRGLELKTDKKTFLKLFPETEKHKFTVHNVENESLKKVDVFKIRFKKGHVDSAKLYFLDGKLAMISSYYYPDKNSRQYAFKNLTSIYGQFVGNKNIYHKKINNNAVIINLRNDIALVNYMAEDLADKLRKISDKSLKKAENRYIENEIEKVTKQLDSLENE